MPATTDRLHLVRHGEVHNPEHLVYADLPGFGLSVRGRRQAGAAAARLGAAPVSVVVSSPLQRAVETAEMIAAKHGIAVVTDERLSEWELLARWAGHRWPDLPDDFPGEVEAYLDDPSRLPFAAEPLTAVARRVAAAAEDAWNSRHTGHVVVVGHQDPIEAGRRRLTGRSLDDFNARKPAHAAVVTVRPTGERWEEISVFTPDRT